MNKILQVVIAIMMVNVVSAAFLDGKDCLKEYEDQEDLQLIQSKLATGIKYNDCKGNVYQGMITYKDTKITAGVQRKWGDYFSYSFLAFNSTMKSDTPQCQPDSDCKGTTGDGINTG